VICRPIGAGNSKRWGSIRNSAKAYASCGVLNRCARSIGHQTSAFNVLPKTVNGGHSRIERQLIDPTTVSVSERVSRNIQCLHAPVERLECERNIIRSLHVYLDNLQPEYVGTGPCLTSSTTLVPTWAKTPIRRRSGTTSREVRAAKSDAQSDKPVTLPPGRARLATRPCSTGSGISAPTIGMDDVPLLLLLRRRPS
jgi:hypothetical protein